MAKNGRRKGKDGENELARLVNKQLGQDLLSRNLQQNRNGGYDLIVAHTDTMEARRLDEMAIEVKRHQSAKPADIRHWWQQATQQAVEKAKLPVLFYRADREDWKCVLPLFKSTKDHRILKSNEPDPELKTAQDVFDYELNHCLTMSLDLFVMIIQQPDLIHGKLRKAA